MNSYMNSKFPYSFEFWLYLNVFFSFFCHVDFFFFYQFIQWNFVFMVSRVYLIISKAFLILDQAKNFLFSLAQFYDFTL